MKFSELIADNRIVTALEKEKITETTKIQDMVYPIIREGKDLIAESETGSGKTLAYLLPLYEKYKELEKTNQVIILVPTHELAMQVHAQVERISKNSGIKLMSAVIIGNVNIVRQIEKLKEKPQIIIGTAGRIHELIKKKKISAHTVKTIIMDEGDKLLDPNNIEGVKAVIKCTMRDRQLVVLSASVPKKAMDAAKELMKDYVVVKTEQSQTIPKNIEHMYFVVDRRDKLETLRKLTRVMKAKRSMIFINKVSDIEEATYKLIYEGLKADCLHGSIEKENRKKVIDEFKTRKINHLIATDIAARGLHFDGIDTVFHLSITEDPMEYLHRAGRTGRNGQRGRNVLIVTKEEEALLKAYQKKFGINIVKKKLYQGKVVKG